MNVAFLVPDIHDLQTGGNVFNRRVAEALRPETPVQVVPWRPGEEARPALEGADVIVADSLLAQQPDALRAVREAPPMVPLVLLAHYLHCVDPHATDEEATAAERETLDVVDGAIAPSQFVRRALMEEALSATQVKVVRPGIDERHRGALPVRRGGGTPRMLTVANLLPEKGLRPFIEVLRDLRDRAWTWTLVGDAALDPEYAAGVLRRLSSAGLSDRVTWTGPVSPDALRVRYACADLFVLPSQFETCSLSTREAMAWGLPVVGYRGGGMSENVGDAAAGHLVPPGNDRVLRAALRTLLTDPMARARRGRAAWRRSRSFPTWAEAAGRFEDALRTM